MAHCAAATATNLDASRLDQTTCKKHSTRTQVRDKAAGTSETKWAQQRELVRSGRGKAGKNKAPMLTPRFKLTSILSFALSLGSIGPRQE